MLIEENDVPVTALPIAALKTHLRLGTGFATDSVQGDVLEGFLRAAMAAVEARTGKALIARNFTWRLVAWRSMTAQPIPVAPVATLTEMARIYGDDNEEVIPDSAYRLERDLHVPRVLPRASILPTIPMGGAMRLRFTAGFGPHWTDVPADLAQAVMLLAAHYYEYRGETGFGEGCMPFGVTTLLARYRNLRMTMGAGR